MLYDTELIETTTAILQRGARPAPPGATATLDRPLWQLLERSGLTLISLPAALGGSDGEMLDAAAVLETTAWAGAQGPVAECVLLVSWLLEQAGLAAPSGVGTATASTGIRFEQTAGGFQLTGTLPAVPWGGDADYLVVAADDGQRCLVAVLTESERPFLHSTGGRNLAGEPRDNLELDGVRVPASRAIVVDRALAAEFQVRGALARTIQIAGAARAALELTIDYVAVREQFGRPLAAFQAVQQQLAGLAAEVAMMRVASQAAAAAAAGTSAQFAFSVACAKTAVSSSVRSVAASAHQLHGAMGVTAEYPLGRATRSMWAWRSEFGDDGAWAEAVAREAGDDVWAAITLADTAGPAGHAESRS